MITPIADLSLTDAQLFKAWFEAEIKPRYPLSSEITADWMLNLAASDDDPLGYFTLRKTMWKATSATGETIGFTIATEKRGGSVKFGPTLVAPSHRARGVGRSLRLAAEEHYKERGFRKSYSTTNLRNTAGIYYLVAIGYGIEAHCRSHYQTNVDEVILGKLLIPSRIPKQIKPAGSASTLLRRLAPYYDGLDETFETNLFRCATREADLGNEVAHTNKQKVIFGQPEEDFCVTTPKRVGAVKIGPLLATDPDGLRAILGEVETYYLARNARKLYCIVPLEEAWLAREMRLLQWELEGTLREPYRPLCDMAVLSRFLMSKGAK
jgi:GNAT superfamily N-acetyltransferase